MAFKRSFVLFTLQFSWFYSKKSVSGVKLLQLFFKIRKIYILKV